MKQLRITESTIGFADIYEAPFFPDDDHAKQANMLVLPSVDSEQNGYFLTEFADEFAHYAQQAESEGAIIEVALRDEEYRVVQKHFELVDVGQFIVRDVCFGLLINLISSFIYDRFACPQNDDPEVELKFEAISQSDNGKSVSISYKGPVDGLSSIKDAMESAID